MNCPSASNPNPGPSLKFELCLLAMLALLWGSSYLLIKIAVADIPPVTLIAARVSIAAVFLLAVLAWQRAPLPSDAATWGKLFIQSVFTAIGAWTLLAWGQQFVDSGLAGVLNSTSPIFVFLITALVMRGPSPGAWKFGGACLGLIGVTLIIGVDVLAGLGQQVMAQLAVLLGAVLYACAAIYGRRFNHITPTATAAGTMIWAAAMLVPLSLIIERPWTLQPSTASMLTAGGLGVFCTGVALLIYFRLVRTLGSMETASQSYLRSGVSVALGVIVLGEQVTPVVGAGLACAILGVAAINYRPRAKP